MKNASLCAVFCALLLCPTIARAVDTPESVFFSRDELESINAAVKTARHNNPIASADRIHLGGIIYTNDDDWSLWLQGERVTPESQNAARKIIEVTPKHVRLEVTPPQGGAPIAITLLPHQTYRFSTGQISEGDD